MSRRFACPPGLAGIVFIAACGAKVELTSMSDGGGAGDSSGAAPPPAGGFYYADARYPDVPPQSVGGFAEDAACAAQSIQAERVPLDLYVMMDSSYSMLERTGAGGGGPSKWEAIRAAMASFVGDPQSAGLGVGLQYFPLVRPDVPDSCTSDAACGATGGPCRRIRICYAPGVTRAMYCEKQSDCAAGQQCVLLGQCAQTPQYSCPALPGVSCQGGRNNVCQEIPGYCLGRDSCDAAAYARPAVPVAPLPGAAAAVMGSLAAHKPDGLTPTSAALSGAIEHARGLGRANPGRRVAVVLATDGLPVSCSPTDIPGIAAIAQMAAAGTPRVPTFVIGVFAPAEQQVATMNLNAIAAAGGTGRAFVINTDQNVTQLFQAALGEIRTVALACEYKIPPPTMGQIDFGKVNVQFTAGNGQVTVIGNVRDRASCHPTLGGWYYDVNPGGGTPTSIAVCETTCARLKGDPRGRVDLVLGCKTQVIE